MSGRGAHQLAINDYRTGHYCSDQLGNLQGTEHTRHHPGYSALADALWFKNKGYRRLHAQLQR